MNEKLLQADSDEYAYLLALLGGVQGNNASTQGHIEFSAPEKHVLSQSSLPLQHNPKANTAPQGQSTRQRMVQEIQDIFPSHDVEFLHACLVNNGWNLEAVSNALLSDSLPSSLRKMKNSCTVKPSLAHPSPAMAGLPNYGALQTRNGAAPFSCCKDNNCACAGRRQLDLDSDRTKKDLVHKTLTLIRTQEIEDEEYNDEYDDSFDALGGRTRWDGEVEVESSIHTGAGYTAWNIISDQLRQCCRCSVPIACCLSFHPELNVHSDLLHMSCVCSRVPWRHEKATG